MTLLKKGNGRDGILLFATYSAILFLLYASYFFAGQVPFNGDAYLPFTELYFPAVAAGEGGLPLWNKFLSAGVPFLSSYTPTMLLGFLPMQLLAYVLYIGFVALGGTFAYLYFEKIGCGKKAALCVSLCYLLSIHIGGGRKSHNLLIYTISLLPVIVYLIEVYFDTRRIRWLLGSSVIMALQFMVGFPQQAIYTDLFLGIYLIAFGLHYRMKISLMLKHGLLWIGTYLSLIAWKLFAIVQQTGFYRSGGGVDAGISTFTSYSIHPVKLIQMAFPRIFGGNSGQAFGPSYSSEADTELFLGHMFLILLLVAIVFLWKNFRVRFALGTMLVTFSYAAMAHIPGLDSVFYHVPIINGFRVPARILFLFLFSGFVLMALGLSALCKPAAWKTLRGCGLWLSGVSIGLVVTIVLTGLILTGVFSGFTGESVALLKYAKECLLKDVIYLVLCGLAVALLYHLREKLGKYAYTALCVVVAVLTLAETLPYTVATTPMLATALEVTDSASLRLREEIGNGKVWDAFAGVDGTHESILSQNLSMTKGIPVINSYIPINNPRLYRMMSGEKTSPLNSSGLLTGSLAADKNLHFQNPLLSMLGVTHVIDSSSLLAEDQGIFHFSASKGALVAQAEQITIPYSGESFSVFSELLALKPDTNYQISFDCATSAEQAFYFDFYGGETYDSNLQQANFTAGMGETHFSVILDSGESEAAAIETRYRVISLSTQDLVLNNFSITEAPLDREENVYILWDEGAGVPIYRNTKSRDILYIPDQIQHITDSEDLINNNITYQVDRVNYSDILESKSLKPQDVTISNIVFSNNKISAVVSAGSDTFVNFSQCYYPGWKAYLDGEQIELNMVNALIMGAEVPAGEHILAFEYRPMWLFTGVGISAVSALSLLGVWLVLRRREKTSSPKSSDTRNLSA